MVKFTGPFLHVFRDLHLAGFLYHRPEWMHPSHGAWQAEERQHAIGLEEGIRLSGAERVCGCANKFLWVVDVCVMDIYKYLSCRIRPGSIMAAAGSTSHTTASRPRLALLCKAMRCPTVIAGLLVLLLPGGVGGWWQIVPTTQHNPTGPNISLFDTTAHIGQLD